MCACINAGYRGMSDPRHNVSSMNLRRRHPGHWPESGCTVPEGRDRTGRDGAGERAAYLNWLAATVSEHGWAVSGVHGEQGRPPWAYSVGLWLRCHRAELVLCGVPMRNAASIINALGARLADGGEFGPGDVLDDVCQARLTFRQVDPGWRASGLLSAADAFYGMVRPPYLQVVWADSDGRFPWSPGFQPAFTDFQPWLWLPRADNPPSSWTSHPALLA